VPFSVVSQSLLGSNGKREKVTVLISNDLSGRTLTCQRQKLPCESLVGSPTAEAQGMAL
jgi:hypothetical protein